MFTSQERKVIIFLCAVFVLGGILRVIGIKYHRPEPAAGALADKKTLKVNPVRNNERVAMSGYRREGISAPRQVHSVKEASPDYSVSQTGHFPNSVNINKAGIAELENIPSIGPKTAQEIIDYRKAHGDFHTLRDLDNVKGIGEKKISIIKKFIIF